MTQERRPVEREVVVTDGGGRGAGFVLAVVVAIVGAIFAIWLVLNMGGDAGGEGGVIPDEVNIDVDEGAGGGGGDGGGGEGGDGS